MFSVRLFPEIVLKSPSVRKRWTTMLAQNLRTQLKRIDDGIRVRVDWDRLIVRSKSTETNFDQEIIDVLSRTPGVAYFSQVDAHEFGTLDDICKLVYPLWSAQLKGKTFCVRVKRAGRHEFSSTDIERKVGGYLFHKIETAGVKLKDPDVTVKLEIKDDILFLVKSRYEGLGGFPLGTQEPVLSLLSGGFDSTVASYLHIKRGVKTHFCFFNLGGREHEVAVKELAFYLWNRYSSSHRVKFITVPFEGVVGEILTKIDPSNMGVVLKRMMVRAAQKIANESNVEALVTGEAIAQVSSQTIHNLSVIDEVADVLVLRPLIVMDKPDIIKLSRAIGTEEFCATIPEYCGVISVKPSAKVGRKSLYAQEEKFDFSILDGAVQSAVIESIDSVMSDTKSIVTVKETSTISTNTIVLDIRHDNERELKPLKMESSLHIPFYRLLTEFEHLDHSKTYLLYCDKGVMSRLHASHLLESGFHNVGVYRCDA